jgi:hypothetical protein
MYKVTVFYYCNDSIDSVFTLILDDFDKTSTYRSELES